MAAFRVFSALTMATVTVASKLFLDLGQRTHTEGLPEFLEVLDARKKAMDEGRKPRALITVSNHLSVMDDPLMWGILPYRYLFNTQNLRWALGSADICFANKPLSTFFTLGHVLPTYRLHKDPANGGLFQPSIAASISLLNSGVWMHIFPEGRVHQHPKYQSRYFKWGVSRLILETEVTPDVVPIFIMGFDQIMHESRTWPRFLPRVGRDVTMIFGSVVGEERWGDLRAEWRGLCKEAEWDGKGEMPEVLREGEKARDLRIRTTARVREEVLKLRRRQGWPEEEADANDPEKYKNGDYEGCCDNVWEKFPPI